MKETAHPQPPLKLFRISLGMALCIAAIDAVLVASLSELSLTEVFLYGFGIFNLSIAAYVLIVLLLSTFFLTIGWKIFLRKFKILHAPNPRFARVIFATVLTIMIFGLRKFSKDGIFSPGYAALFALILLCVGAAAWLLTEKLSNHAAVGSRYRILGTIILVSGLVTVFLLPFARDAYSNLRGTGLGSDPEMPNIVLIVMDTVRADALSCYSNPKNLTPNIDRIAGEGTLFLHAFSSAPWTLPSHASLFTGLYPSQHRARMGHSYLDEGFLTLAEILSQEGYQTAGFSENPFVSRNRGLAQGFNDFFEMYGYRRIALLPRILDVLRRKFSNYNHTGEYTRDTVRYFKKWVSSHSTGERPFFTFLNLMPAHLPHYLREDFRFARPTQEELARIEPVNRLPARHYLPRYRLNEHELGLIRSMYEGDVAYLDRKLGELFSFLRNSRMLDQTLLIITSDHGENFGDHGLIEHTFCLYNTLLHVPLIVRYPREFRPGAVIGNTVSLVHTLRTILEVLGLPEREVLEHVEARSLLDSAGEGPVFAEHENLHDMLKDYIGDEAPEGFDFEPFNKSWTCIFGSDLKLIRSSSGDVELFDFRQDGSEKVDLAPHQADDTARFLTLLRDWEDNLWIPDFVFQIREMDEKTREALKALGYIK